MGRMIAAACVIAVLACSPAAGQPQADTGANTGAKSVAPPPEAQTPMGAQVELEPTQSGGEGKVTGTLSLSSDPDGVRIAGTLKGLQPGTEHAFHVHEKGDCSAPDASSAGEHFNPAGAPHGKPSGGPHHLGDMPNLRANAKGLVEVDVRLAGVTLGSSQANDLVGKAVVLHEKPDDYKSQPAGNSGKRIACGVIH